MLVAVRGAASVGCSKIEFGGTNRVDEYGANFWTAGNSSLQSILALSGVAPWHPERDMAGSAIDALLCDPPGAVTVSGKGRDRTGPLPTSDPAQCADRYGNCFLSHCCSSHSYGCYKRSAFSFAMCRPRATSCEDDDEWLCPGWQRGGVGAAKNATKKAEQNVGVAEQDVRGHWERTMHGAFELLPWYDGKENLLDESIPTELRRKAATGAVFVLVTALIFGGSLPIWRCLLKRAARPPVADSDASRQMQQKTALATDIDGAGTLYPEAKLSR